MVMWCIRVLEEMNIDMGMFGYVIARTICLLRYRLYCDHVQWNDLMYWIECLVCFQMAILTHKLN